MSLYHSILIWRRESSHRPNKLGRICNNHWSFQSPLKFLWKSACTGITLHEPIISKKAISSAFTSLIWTDYYSKFKNWKVGRFTLAKQKPRTLIMNLETKSQRKTNQQFLQQKLLFQLSVTILVVPAWPWQQGEWLSWQHCLAQCCKGYGNLVQLFLGPNLPPLLLRWNLVFPSLTCFWSGLDY